MNVYEKLQTTRVELQGEKMKKSGKNKFAGYDYFELGDFLPKINELMLKHRLASSMRFESELATLTVIDIDKPEDNIIFTSPMSEASLKGCHAVQNLGAVQTYLRRYLYMNAFEIVEHDAIDAGDKPKDKPTKITKAQADSIGELAESLEKQGKLDIGKMLAIYEINSFGEMSPEQFNTALEQFEIAKKRKGTKKQGA